MNLPRDYRAFCDQLDKSGNNKQAVLSDFQRDSMGDFLRWLPEQHLHSPHLCAQLDLFLVTNHVSGSPALKNDGLMLEGQQIAVIDQKDGADHTSPDNEPIEPTSQEFPDDGPLVDSIVVNNSPTNLACETFIHPDLQLCKPPKQKDLQAALNELMLHHRLLPSHLVSDKRWPRIYRLILVVEDLSAEPLRGRCRRDDHHIKQFMSASKIVIYRDLKKQFKLTKSAIFEMIAEIYFGGDQEQTSLWFGKGLRHGLKNTMITWLFEPEGGILFQKLTDPQHIRAVIQFMHSETKRKIEGSILKHLNNKSRWAAFLSGKKRTTKLPSSFNGNLMSPYCLFQRVLNYGLLTQPDTTIPQFGALHTAIELVRVKLQETETGRLCLDAQPAPQANGYLEITRMVPIFFIREE